MLQVLQSKVDGYQLALTLMWYELSLWRGRELNELKSWRLEKIPLPTLLPWLRKNKKKGITVNANTDCLLVAADQVYDKCVGF